MARRWTPQRDNAGPCGVHKIARVAAWNRTRDTHVAGKRATNHHIRAVLFLAKGGGRPSTGSYKTGMTASMAVARSVNEWKVM